MPARLFREDTVRSLLVTAGHNPEALDDLLNNAEKLEIDAEHPELPEDWRYHPARAAFEALDRMHGRRRALIRLLVEAEDPKPGREKGDVDLAIADLAVAFLTDGASAVVYALVGVSQMTEVAQR